MDVRLLAVFLGVLGASVFAVGCSDTKCHDKLAPGGEIVTSDQCAVAEGRIEPGGEDAGGGNNAAEDAAMGEDGGDRQDAEVDDVLDQDDVDMPDNNPNNNSNPDNNPNNNAGVGGAEALRGQWVSEGDDLAPILRSGDFAFRAVTVNLKDDGTYEGLFSFETGDEVPYGGTYSIDDATEPFGIVLRQTAPASLTSGGIVAVEGEVMRLEVVQVEPPTPGFQPPTPEGGFGSTVGTSDSDENIQTYRRP